MEDKPLIKFEDGKLLIKNKITCLEHEYIEFHEWIENTNKLLAELYRIKKR